jgi:murein hydrolase activator
VNPFPRRRAKPGAFGIAGRRWRGLGVINLLLVASAATWAAKSDARAGEQGKLRTLHHRIENLNRQLIQTTQSQANVADQLREVESAISVTNRDLRRLAEQRAAIGAALEQLGLESHRVEVQIEAQQKQLARLLYRHYVDGEPDPLRLLLSGADPNQVARNRYFLLLLSRAKAQLLGDLRDALAQKKQLADEASVKNAELAEIGKKQEQNRELLLARQQQRQTVLAQISGKIKAQRREIATLKADEARLSSLIAGLTRNTRKPRKHPPIQTTTAPDPDNQQTPEASTFHGAFATLRGKLRLPVRGTISGRYGTPRADSGSTWKGLFIRAAEGAEVKAVAAGRVVFADWLRGFGNLLIVDHGDGYMSVYGNNQSLFRETGEEVKAGDTVAAVGNSGGNPESGLYFELRQQGQAFDPLRWAVLQ